jgi:glycosyltransferase involved in cell wall biosynthesis
LGARLDQQRGYVYTADAALEDGCEAEVVQAMARGLPLVATPAPGLPVEDGYSAFVSADLPTLQGRLRELESDTALAARIGRRGREVAEAEFSEERFVEGWLRVIEHAVHRRRPACLAPSFAC